MHSIRPVVIVVLLSVLPSGCGGSNSTAGPGYGSADGRSIAELVEQVNDVKSNPAQLLKLFAAGAAPKDKAQIGRYTAYYFDVSGNPSVSGDTATAKVKIRPDGKAAGTDAEVEWSFVKDGGGWKIKSAPLP